MEQAARRIPELGQGRPNEVGGPLARAEGRGVALRPRDSRGEKGQELGSLSLQLGPPGARVELEDEERIAEVPAQRVLGRSDLGAPAHPFSLRCPSRSSSFSPREFPDGGPKAAG
jgi:hypothetical protein